MPKAKNLSSSSYEQQRNVLDAGRPTPALNLAECKANPNNGNLTQTCMTSITCYVEAVQKHVELLAMSTLFLTIANQPRAQHNEVTTVSITYMVQLLVANDKIASHLTVYLAHCIFGQTSNVLLQSAHCAARMLLLSDKEMRCCAAGTNGCLHFRRRAFALDGRVSAKWSRCPGSKARRVRDSVPPLRRSSAGWMLSRIGRLSAGAGHTHSVTIRKPSLMAGSMRRV